MSSNFLNCGSAGYDHALLLVARETAAEVAPLVEGRLGQLSVTSTLNSSGLTGAAGSDCTAMDLSVNSSVVAKAEGTTGRTEVVVTVSVLVARYTDCLLYE